MKNKKNERHLVQLRVDEEAFHEIARLRNAVPKWETWPVSSVIRELVMDGLRAKQEELKK
jgi:hypothetical protein